MKARKVFKSKKKALLIASAIAAMGLAGSGYYFLNREKSSAENINTNTDALTTTDSEVRQNIEQKDASSVDGVTTTPSVVAETPKTTSLSDVSLTILRDSDMTQAYVYFYGPAGTYGAEKLVSGVWTVLVPEFSYTGRGGYGFDTVTSSETNIHYRVFRLENGAKVAVSGDTLVTWQQIASNNDGTLSVPLAE
jgi:hypothetical protein